MTFVKKILPYLLVVVLILTFLDVLLAVSPGCPGELVAQNEGVPIIKTEPIPANRLGIQQIAESSDRIYLLHQAHPIVSVYNVNGEYAYTISVFSHNNGRAQIAVVQDKLHLLDKKGNLYVFNDKQLVLFSSYDDSATQRMDVDFDTQSSKYYREGSNIYTYVQDGTSELVIERPWYLSLFQRGTTFELIIHGALLVLGAVFVLLSRHANKNKKSSSSDIPGGQGDGLREP